MVGGQEEILQLRAGNTAGISSMKGRHPNMCSQGLLSVLVGQAANQRPHPPVHPGMQELKWAGNHAWMRTNGRLPTPLCFDN